MIRVSSGTASVLGLKKIRQPAPPTTAYFLVGERCRRSCSYCAHSKDATTGPAFLSRITWPEFEKEAVREALKEAEASGRIARLCVQVSDSYGAQEESLDVVKYFRAAISLPISLSICPGPGIAGKAKEAGVTTLCHALDAATPEIFSRHRNGEWQNVISQLQQALEYFPGNVSTHLMAGLGETLEEMVDALFELKSAGIRTGLFAFTPLPGTRSSCCSPPDMGYYRRVQLAHFLINKGVSRDDALAIPEGIIKRWEKHLSTGEAFMTSGCAGCNRPYYNERPGDIPYNYPVKLEKEEAWKELELAMKKTPCSWKM